MMAITINNSNSYQDNLEIVNLKEEDNLLIIKVDTELNYKMAISNDMKFYDLKFKPNRLYEEDIKYAVMMKEGRILSGYKLLLQRVIYNAEIGEISEISVEEVNLKFNDESLTDTVFNYKTRYSSTVFKTTDIMKRMIYKIVPNFN